MIVNNKNSKSIRKIRCNSWYSSRFAQRTLCVMSFNFIIFIRLGQVTLRRILLSI